MHSSCPAGDQKVSCLLNMPAVWPYLALNPEPMRGSADPESVERWYSELFGMDSLAVPILHDGNGGPE